MISSAINHMTAANASFDALLDMATTCGCSGVELRNDLASKPFLDEEAAKLSGTAAKARGLDIVALAELAAFNQFSDNTLLQAKQLASLAHACGAKGIVLIPANDGSNPSRAERLSTLSTSLNALRPVLEEYDLCGFVEPLGFEASTLRFKSEVVEVLESEGLGGRFKLVHDTFHHFLAGEDATFAKHTGIVHVSGVEDKNLTPAQMQDAHRVLVNEHDRINNMIQLETLVSNGYTGPVSMEAFAPEVHALPSLTTQLQDSFHFINSGLAKMVA